MLFITFPEIKVFRQHVESDPISDKFFIKLPMLKGHRRAWGAETTADIYLCPGQISDICPIKVVSIDINEQGKPGARLSLPIFCRVCTPRGFKDYSRFRCPILYVCTLHMHNAHGTIYIIQYIHPRRVYLGRILASVHQTLIQICLGTNLGTIWGVWWIHLSACHHSGYNIDCAAGAGVQFWCLTHFRARVICRKTRAGTDEGWLSSTVPSRFQALGDSD